MTHNLIYCRCDSPLLIIDYDSLWLTVPLSLVGTHSSTRGEFVTCLTFDRFPSQDFVPKSKLYFSNIPQQKNNSTERRKRLCLELADREKESIRTCKNCARRGKTCMVSEDGGKCIECIRLASSCDLFISGSDWRRLREKRTQLLREERLVEEQVLPLLSRLKQIRQEIDGVDNDHQELAQTEDQNICNLEIAETFANFDANSFLEQLDVSSCGDFSFDTDIAGGASGGE